MITRQDFLRLAGAGLAGLALPGLAGCGGEAAGDGDGTLTVWDYYGPPDSIYGRALHDLYRRYMRANRGVTVKKRFLAFDEFNRTLLQSGAGGGLPDIALVNAFDTGMFAKAGILNDLSDRVQRWGEADEYVDTSWETTVWQDRCYGLPHVADCYVLWYNVDHFEQAGVEPPETWDELGDVARRLSTGERTGFAFSAVKGVQGATAWVIRFLAAGGDVTEIAGPAGETALRQWVELVESGAASRSVLEWIEEDAYSRFRSGRASMMLQSASYVNVLKEEAPDLNWSVSLLPTDRRRASLLSAENLVITTGSDDVDAAWDLIAHMQRPAVLERYLPERNKLPARTDVARGPLWTDDPVWSVFSKQLPTAWAPQGDVALNSAEIFTHIQEAIQAALSGTAVGTALSRSQEKIDAVMAE